MKLIQAILPSPPSAHSKLISFLKHLSYINMICFESLLAFGDQEWICTWRPGSNHWCMWRMQCDYLQGMSMVALGAAPYQHKLAEDSGRDERVISNVSMLSPSMVGRDQSWPQTLALIFRVFVEAWWSRCDSVTLLGMGQKTGLEAFYVWLTGVVAHVEKVISPVLPLPML